MNLNHRSVLCAGLMVSTAILGGWPLASSAQVAQPADNSSPAKPVDNVQTAPGSDKAVALSPFTVTTDKDTGYGATNAMSGSRVNTPIKDLPIPVQVITSEFISDIGATDLRQSLSYVAGIELNSQNDLDNLGATFGSAYGPGGVNNPAGVTVNPNQVQLKIRGFITNNTLRDGFLRGNGTDAVNIDRIEVVEGPNALLYGTGNFGGVVDYLTKQPQDKQQGIATFGVGTYDFLRSTVDVTGPISAANHLDYRISGAWETEKTNIHDQKTSHYFIAPSLSWKPTPKTEIDVEGEYGRSKANGFGFQALRAAQGNSATPINNDQLEAVAFYFPPGANPRTYNLSGPDTFDNQRSGNIEIKATQNFLKEEEIAPQIDFLVGYNHSTWNDDAQNISGQITGPILLGQPGYALSQTITTLGAVNGLGGQTVSNGNLLFGTLPNSVVKYGWNQGNNDTTRDQERVELVMHKSLFEGKWFQMEEQVLGGYSEILNTIKLSAANTPQSQLNYKSPNDLNPIVFGHQGDGSPDTAMYQSDRDNINKGWDSAYYLNSYFKFLNIGGVADRIILMDGIRKDKNDNWSTNTTISAPGATPATTGGSSAQVQFQSSQNGIILKLTNSFSVYALRSQGFQPNFGTQHDAATGAPVGANTARSKEWGVKFDFWDGKLSGTISNYKITKVGWTGAPWFAPAPLGHYRFDPTKPIVYNLEGGFNGQGVAGATQLPGVPASSQGAPIQTDPTVIAAWNAAVAAGAVTHLSPITNAASDPNAIYLNASTPQGAAYMDAAFASVFTNGGNWPGWPYQGNSINDPNINNATLDAGGFQNGSQNPAYQTIDEARGWDGTLLFSPNKQIQIFLSASINSTVKQVSAAQWVQYAYPQDKWASWYFPNGGFGLQGSTLAQAFTDPTNTSTHVQNLYPGDDTPKNSFSGFVKYDFDDHSSLKGLSAGIGVTWHSEQVIFSGITHGAGQAQYNGAGQLLILTAPSQYTLNGFAQYEWKSGNFGQYVQLNVDNMLNDTKLYGLIYKSPLTAKLTYGIKF